VPLCPNDPSLPGIVLCATAILGACSGPARDDTPLPGLSAAAASSASTGPAPAPRARNQKHTALESETGKGEILTDKHVPEVWIPDVEVHDLAVHRGSLWWSDSSGVHERPFDGEVRAVLPGVRARGLVADEDGVVFAVVTGPQRFEVQQVSAEARAPRRLARMTCDPLRLAPARSFVVVASTCGIFAVPRQGGAPRRLEPVTHVDVSITADRDQVCYVNDKRLTCRSLVDSKERPLVMDALRPGPLLLDRQVLYALEEGRMADVPIDGDYGRLVRWEVPTGDRRVLTSQQFEATALLHDEGAIYYGTGGGSVRRVSKDGRKVQTLHHVDRDETPRLAIGGGHIYFALYSEQGIRRIRLAVQ
jgi:hypothetical protein